MKRANDFKIDLILAFSLFGFLIIIVTTYVSIYIFNKIATQEFHDKIKLISSNIYREYNSKENTIKLTTDAIIKNDIFNSTFEPNINVIKSIFKTMLYANNDLKEINYFNYEGKNILSCYKLNSNVFCDKSFKTFNVTNFKKNNQILINRKFKNNAIEFDAAAPLKIGTIPGFIEVKALIKNIFKKNDIYHVIFIDNKGDVLYSNIYKEKNLNDIFNYLLNKQILNMKNGFVSDEIYVKSIAPNMKIIFIQNKKIIDKTNEISKKITIIMIVISIFLAIPLGVFFSKPLYNFYQMLDLKVQEEIEKRRQKEQILFHQSKLAALGEMLGNIAHQWRHPITRLSLLIQNFDLAYKKGKLTPEFIEKFKQNALMQINYMSETIDDFSNFFKKDTEKVEFCPYEVINDALKLIEGRIKNNGINVDLKVISKKPLYGYKSEFSQVILNILNNAIDVLKNKNLTEKNIFIRIYENKIEIEDNGGGVKEEIKDKIFEPYFTTKFQSQGTGIGLYMSKVIITQHFSGKLYFYNSNKGAVFVIEI